MTCRAKQITRDPSLIAEISISFNRQSFSSRVSCVTLASSGQGDPPCTSQADYPSQAHHLSEQVSAEVITLLTFTAPQLMDRDYIDWLEMLPCNRKPQKVNQWMGEWAAIA